MRVGLECNPCALDGNAQLVEMFVTDSDAYEFTCLAGHHNVIVVREPKFELLLEVATEAIVDGYNREAVVTFTSALERFQERYFRTVSIARGVGPASIDTTWTRVRKQSERQLGLYLAAHLLETGAAAPVLAENYVTLRNKVAHDGKIPTRAKAIAYGQAVLDLIIPLWATMLANYPEGCNALAQADQTYGDSEARKLMKADSAWGSYLPWSKISPAARLGERLVLDQEVELRLFSREQGLPRRR